MRWIGKVPRHCRFCEKRFYVMVEIVATEFPQTRA